VINENPTVRLAGMRLGLKPFEVAKIATNPRELTARLRYQQTFPQS
jgi:hypothetical protein